MNYKLLIIPAVCISMQMMAQTPVFNWAKKLSGTGNDLGWSITTDAAGNVYTTGSFEGAVNFDPAGSFYLTSAGYGDIFISKLDPSGHFMWAKQIGDVNPENAFSITCDFAGNVYVTGWFSGNVDFDPGAGTFYMNAPVYNSFTCKLDDAGNFKWAASNGSSGEDTGTGITTDPVGNVYSMSYESSAGNSLVIYKRDSSGNFQWSKHFGSGETAHSISLDAVGNIYITGLFAGTADFDPGAGTNMLTATGNSDIYVCKLTSAGNFAWAFNIGSSGTSSLGKAVVVDNTGNIYYTGHFEGTCDFDPGTGTYSLTSAGVNDLFMSKIDSSGNFIWAKKIGSSGSDEGSFIYTDVIGHVFCVGYFSGMVDFNPDTASVFNLTSAGSNDIFISMFDSSGNFGWVKQIGGMSAVTSNCINVDASGSIYTTGSFQGTVDFDPGSGTSNLTSVGANDIFIHKMSMVTVGNSEYTPTKFFTVYPNPARGNFTILLDNYDHGSVTIIDITGKVLQNTSFNNTNILNLSIDAAPGFYIVEIKANDGKTGMMKLVKE